MKISFFACVWLFALCPVVCFGLTVWIWLRDVFRLHLQETGVHFFKSVLFNLRYIAVTKKRYGYLSMDYNEMLWQYVLPRFKLEATSTSE